jgi:hypothetical protein
VATNDVTVGHIRVACWISKATCTFAHAHAPAYPYAGTHAHAWIHRPISNVAFPRQQWFAISSQIAPLVYTYLFLQNVKQFSSFFYDFFASVEFSWYKDEEINCIKIPVYQPVFYTIFHYWRSDFLLVICTTFDVYLDILIEGLAFRKTCQYL